MRILEFQDSLLVINQNIKYIKINNEINKLNLQKWVSTDIFYFIIIELMKIFLFKTKEDF